MRCALFYLLLFYVLISPILSPIFSDFKLFLSDFVSLILYPTAESYEDVRAMPLTVYTKEYIYE